MREIKIGDIGWGVFMSRATVGPWLCPMEVVGMSPTGQSLHWKALKFNTQPIFKGRYQASLTPREAIDIYQRMVLAHIGGRYLLDNNALRLLVRLVTQSEALLKESVED